MDREDVVFILGFVSFMGLALLGAYWGVAWLSQKECEVKGIALQMPYRWQMIGGCFVQVRDRWVPIRSYRVLD